ncbi:MAG: pyrroline-5-carboxylate reductase [Frankiales bacterium]|nr:pyrroline-5-carboxylate reductase [Frankiales bacterium]
MSSTVVAVVGVGKMGEAVLAGLVRAGTEVIASERVAERSAEIAGRYGVRALDPAPAAAEADVVLLVVKPQDVRATAAEIAPALRPGTLVVSLAAGITTAVLEAVLPPGTPVVRVMSNTPALVGQAMSAASAGATATDAHLAQVEELLRPVGRVVRVPEAQQDAVTALSGSGPAYAFRVVEAMVAAGTALGLSAEVAGELAQQTLLGAATLLAGSDQTPAQLREAVTSPGGTTAAALAVLEERGIGAAFLAAMTAARDRSAELAG